MDIVCLQMGYPEKDTASPIEYSGQKCITFSDVHTYEYGTLPSLVDPRAVPGGLGEGHLVCIHV